MTLLTSMMERPLDPGYAAAAAERERAGLPASTGTRTPTVLVAALVAGLLLTLGALALRTPSTAAVKAKADLVAQIEQRRGQVDREGARLRELQAEVDTLQERALGQDETLLQSRLDALTLVTGGDAVTGEGIRVVLDDAPDANGSNPDSDPRTDAEKKEGTVFSKDMQVVVNGLWEAGAEAISINGQRLTSKSAIRFAGEAILVNYRPLARPYTISVLGSRTDLQTEFAENAGGAYARALQDNYGIRVSIDAVDSMTLPAASSLTVRYARVPSRETTTGTAPGPTTSPETTTSTPTTSESAP